MYAINYGQTDTSGSTWLTAQGSKVLPPAPPSDNTMLYIALGGGGVAYTLLVVCFIRVLHALTVF
ncbi:hypothetical protein NK8_67320 (plasmid) [Caballeronia sp. NK8]|uniref:hypothetical protein n=1 Tax=Caballeronia sp. NK8 TaxID=140098 RepID=UPI001BB5DC14|nr:hypothetical protein [Caballeronia sp. NK8]BCQ28542.1 hypothetical protein NK8_67320 [Caballeronia sp. NK8]